MGPVIEQGTDTCPVEKQGTIMCPAAKQGMKQKLVASLPNSMSNTGQLPHPLGPGQGSSNSRTLSITMVR